MVSRAHVHTLKPFIDPEGKTLFHRCTSCAFKCTNRVVKLVESMPKKHVRVAATDPQASVPWDYSPHESGTDELPMPSPGEND
jgi:hypothetical protein